METRLAAPHPSDAATYRVISGAILAVVGAVVVMLSTFTTLVTVVGVGALLIAGGVALFVDALRGVHRHRWPWLLVSLAAVGIGGLVLGLPRTGVRVVTPVLLALFFLDGAFLALDAWRERMPLWGVQFAAGLIEAALGVFFAVRGFHLALGGTLVGLLLVSRGLGLLLVALRLRGVKPQRR